MIGTPVADPYGNFWLDFPDDQDPPIHMVPGDTVTVSAGGATKTTVVTRLEITGVEGNVVSGIADTSTVQLWVGGTPVSRSVAVVDGHWSANVGEPGLNPSETATTTLGAGSFISTEEMDEDGDGTQADYNVRAPRFAVNLDGRGISATQFAPGSTLVLTINEKVLDTNESTFNENGDIWFEFDSSLEIHAGDTVVVGDGTTTKTTVVTDIAISPIVGDTASGTATAGPVNVWVEDADDVWREVPVVGGAWSTDFTAPGATPREQNTTTLGPGVRVSAEQVDEDGDSTVVGTHVFDPQFVVGVNGPWVQGEDFAPNGTVTITKNGAAITTDAITTDRNGQFWLDSPVAFATDDTVVVTDSNGVIETLVISPLVVDPIAGNVISGHAMPNARVSVGVYEANVGRDFTADAAGVWSVDVSAVGTEEWEQQTVELVRGSSGSAEEWGETGNRTHVDWRVPDPSFNAHAADDSIWGTEFGEPVTVTIHPVTGEDRTWSGDAISYDGGEFNLSTWDPVDAWDLQPGQTVTVTGPNGTKTLVIADLAVSGYDAAANTVSGTTDRGDLVNVRIENGDDESPYAEAQPRDDGTWVVDFDESHPPYDLARFDQAWITQIDEDGDATNVGPRTIAQTRFIFSPVIQDVVGSGWPDGSKVTLTIHRDGVPDFVATPTPESCMAGRDSCPSQYLPNTGGENVFFNLSIGPFQAQAGDVMTMSDGTITKTLVVPDKTFGPDEGDYLWTDDDDDQAFIPAPKADLGMDPQADRVWISDLPAAGDVTVTIKRGGDTVHTQTVHTTNVLTRGEWLLDMWTQPTGNAPRPAVAKFDLGGFDLKGGDVVTATYGSGESKTRTVANLSVDSVNAETDTVTGTADQSVGLHLGDGEGGYWGYDATPDPSGHWSFHFDELTFPGQGLEPGMHGQAIIDHNTIVFWTVGEGHDGNVTVTADDQAVDFGIALPDLTWTADDPDAAWTTEPACTTTAVAGSPVGTYPITCTGAVADGYTVAYEDAVLTIAPAAQTIDFTTLTDQMVGTPPLALHATASSGLPVAFTTSTPTVCTITGKKLDKLTLVGPGACTVAADQVGDGNHLAAPTASQTITVTAPVATVAVTSDRATSVAGQAVKCTATVTGPAAKPTGTATFMDGTTALATVPLNCGSAVLTTKTLAVGVHDISVVYSGDGTYATATGTLAGGLTVTTPVATVAVTSDRATSVAGGPVKCTATVTGPAAKPTGTATFMDGTTALATVPLKNGAAVLTIKTLAVGVHDISVVYSGDGTYATATGTLAGGLTVTKAASKVTVTNAPDLLKKSSKVGVAYVVKVRVVAVAAGTGLPTGTIDITDGTTTCSATLAADGSATCTFTPTTAGVVTITATYGGDAGFVGSAATATHTIATP